MPASLAVIGGDASGVDKGTMRLIFGTSGWTISRQGIKRASFPLVFSHLISLILSTTTTTTLSTSQVTNFNQPPSPCLPAPATAAPATATRALAARALYVSSLSICIPFYLSPVYVLTQVQH